jgi:ABC-type sugar transport system substrate-binding protein
LKRLMLLVALMVLLVAVPALVAAAQRNNDNNDVVIRFNGDRFNNDNGVSQEIGNENESGDVSATFSVQSTGNNSNQCVTPLQFGNTGSNQNAQGFLQYNSTADDLEAEGGTFEFAPVLNASCNQAVQQSSAASSG